jgi:hypothetical protein
MIAENAAVYEARKGLEGCGAAPARSAGAGAIAEPRKARFPARRAGNAPKLPGKIFVNVKLLILGQPPLTRINIYAIL